MPEGDTVWRTARRLHLALAGQQLTRCDLRWPSLATVDLTGRTTLEVVSRGKHLLHRVSGDLTLHSHLRMEGSWRVHPATRHRRLPSTTRAVLAGTDHVAVGTSLGMLDLVPTREEHTLVGHLGPDLLGADWDARTALQKLLAAPEREVAVALLDQRNLAGIGTLYASESLFLRRVDPWAAVGELSPQVVAAVVDTARQALLVNCRNAVQRTTTSTMRDLHWVHGRHRRPCLHCGTPVQLHAIGQAPQDRVFFHCPACQGSTPPGPELD